MVSERNRQLVEKRKTDRFVLGLRWNKTLPDQSGGMEIATWAVEKLNYSHVFWANFVQIDM